VWNLKDKCFALFSAFAILDLALSQEKQNLDCDGKVSRERLEAESTLRSKIDLGSERRVQNTLSLIDSVNSLDEPGCYHLTDLLVFRTHDIFACRRLVHLSIIPFNHYSRGSLGSDIFAVRNLRSSSNSCSWFGKVSFSFL
jgi:hypothetical protein